MTTDPRGLWQDGDVVDEIGRPLRPRRFALAFLLALLVLEALLTAASRGAPPAAFETLADADDVRTVLERAAAQPDPWLLIGDSVLVGDVMQGRVEDWRTQRVIDHLRHQRALDHTATFQQVALDGLLPVDILRIVTELDRIDPRAHVPVVIEINPRYASRHYSAQGSCSRPWLCELGIPLLDRDGVDWVAWAEMMGHALTRALLDHAPIVRHRKRLNLHFDLAGVPSLVTPRDAPPAPVDPLQARARMLEHYRDPDLSDRSAQIRALQATVALLRANHRRAVFFTTPLNDAFYRDAVDEQGAGDIAARWSEIVDAPGATTSLVNLDHPLFTDALFLDHCHMGPEGNQRLAINLLHELGIGLAQVPPRAHMVHPEGPDATLVARIAMGNANGAGWQAAFQEPRGVAVHRGGDRVVIADTGNHCLRELSGNLQTVRTLAGSCGERGDAEDLERGERLDGPTAPHFFGDDLYFTMRRGRILARVSGQAVSIRRRLDGPKWSKIRVIRSGPKYLYLLDGGKRILRFDPVRGVTKTLVTWDGEVALRTFDVTTDGRIFVADAAGKIWSVSTRAVTKLGVGRKGAELVFANVAPTTLPEKIGAFFPFSFEEVKLHDVVDLQWVERYGGFVVADDVPLQRGKRKRVTERIHLRFFSPEDRLVFPWLKPRVYDGGHVMQHALTESLVTPIHVGAMALDPSTATTFYLEQGRSRLFRFGDGLLGAALVGNTNTFRVFNMTREFFGWSSGQATLDRFRPDRFVDRRTERVPRKGPYLAVMFGSSMIGASDSVGMYSLGRRVEQVLQDALGYRDGIRLDLVVRSVASMSFKRAANHLEEFVDSGLQPDVVFVELRTVLRFFGKRDTDEDIVEVLERFRSAAERTDALLIFIDLTPMVGYRRDGLRTGGVRGTELIGVIRDAGFIVFEPGDAMLEDHLSVSPWASPPFNKHHASPWAVDATGERVAALAYPHVRAHLRGRVPSRLRDVVDPMDEQASIGSVIDEFTADFDGELLPINPSTMQREYAQGHLELFVDLATVAGAESGPIAASEYPLVALSCIRELLSRNRGAAMARSVTIRLANFSSYDEYGNGALEGADVRFERTLDADGLRTFIGTVLDRPR